jgi:hypothetical protein
MKRKVAFIVAELGADTDPFMLHIYAALALARHQRHALGPTSRDIDHRQCLDKRASHGCAAMGHHVDLAEPGGGSCQSLNVRIGTSRRTAE